MDTITDLETAWNDAGKALWEAEAEQDRAQHLYQLVDEGRKVLAWVCLYYLIRGVVSERAVKRARKDNERARQALKAAQVPDEMPAPDEA